MMPAFFLPQLVHNDVVNTSVLGFMCLSPFTITTNYLLLSKKQLISIHDQLIKKKIVAKWFVVAAITPLIHIHG